MAHGPKPASLHLSEDERTRLTGFVRRRNVGQALAQRARIVLACAEPGSTNSGVAVDRGYSSHRFRERVRESGAKPAILFNCNEALARCPDWIYTNRNIVERLWAGLKEWRAVAARYETTAARFTGVFCDAATLDDLR